jgi:isopenicillin-N N-acyltransferase like protein
MAVPPTRREFLETSAAALLPEIPKEFPVYHAAGQPREMGRAHGEQAGRQIFAHLDHMRESQKLTAERMRRRALRFEPLFERYCPHLLEEMRGVGEGAGVPLADALAVSIRGELGQAPEGCTTYTISRRGTKSRGLLVGQNSDMSTINIRLGYVLHLKPAGKPALLTWTFGGMIGYHGMNSEGVAHFANALGGGPAARFAMPHYPVKRLMLECSRMPQVLALLKTIPLASNGNYVLSDGAGAILDVEATTEGPLEIRDNGAGFLAHTNHFLAAPHATEENYRRGWKDSRPRLERMNSLLASKFGALTVEDLKAFLSDHANPPTSICRHDGDSRTAASIIAEPDAGRMHVAAGNPCQSRYVTYTI